MYRKKLFVATTQDQNHPNIVHQDYIYGYVSPGTLAELRLLSVKFRKLERKNFSGKWQQIEFNVEFLRERLKQHHELHCEFCGKSHLKIFEWFQNNKDREIIATADHFYPKSKYPDLKMNRHNFVVACNQCNQDKADNSWPISVIKFPYPDTIQKIQSLQIYD